MPFDNYGNEIKWFRRLRDALRVLIIPDSEYDDLSEEQKLMGQKLTWLEKYLTLTIHGFLWLVQICLFIGSCACDVSGFNNMWIMQQGDTRVGIFAAVIGGKAQYTFGKGILQGSGGTAQNISGSFAIIAALAITMALVCAGMAKRIWIIVEFHGKGNDATKWWESRAHRWYKFMAVGNGMSTLGIAVIFLVMGIYSPGVMSVPLVIYMAILLLLNVYMFLNALAWFDYTWSSKALGLAPSKNVQETMSEKVL